MTGRAVPAALPPAVRQRVLGLASDVLGALPPDEVPASLRAVARFAPARRARAGAAPLAAALESDAVFRRRVSAGVRLVLGELAAALDQGAPPPAADPVDVAAVAYLTRPDGWAGLLAAAGDRIDAAEREEERAGLERTSTRLAEQLEALRAAGAAEADRLRADADVARSEAAEARRRVRELEAELGRSRAAVAQARSAEEAAAARSETDASSAATEVRRLRSRLAEAEAIAEQARRAAREGRSSEDVRLRLLLDTVIDAAQGLRRELALPPVGTLPADLLAAGPEGGSAAPVAGVSDLAVRALDLDDPAVLDQLLALPRVHLVVDGYNVTKSGYGGVSLAEQRTRLLSGLGALAARTRAEVTCVFDGATLDGPVPTSAPRGVRVLFSPEGTTADELIRRLVRAEPAGRPVVVVSTDREVADGVSSAGARAVPSAALLRRLDRA